ncbi:MAG TPA: TIGR03435 family protein [Bryobacteraceae bacterium]|nr:TIGR03435 family protein [Bryobacteraceae bacterium]
MWKTSESSQTNKAPLLAALVTSGSVFVLAQALPGPGLLAQSAQAPDPGTSKFEVASIKPVSQGGEPSSHIGITSNSARIDIGQWSIRQLIIKAYRIEPYQLVGGPDWMSSLRFDIQATLPQGSNQKQIPEMLRSLLAERFGLVSHADTKELSGFELTVDKGGPKMEAAPPELSARSLTA